MKLFSLYLILFFSYFLTYLWGVICSKFYFISLFKLTDDIFENKKYKINRHVPVIIRKGKVDSLHKCVNTTGLAGSEHML